MATYHIPPPSQLCLKGDMVENVKMFKAAWNNWMIATGLTEKLGDDAGKRMVAATLLSVVGMEAVRVVNTLPRFTEEVKINPTDLLKELESHFVPERHVLFERYKFNMAIQTESESTDAFVVRLRTLIQSCEYEALEESILRDRLVIGTHDRRSRDRLLRERPVPNLARSIEVMKAAELSKQYVVSTNLAQEKELHAYDKTGRNRAHGKSGKSGKSEKTGSPSDCGYCGLVHKKGQCTAYGKDCSKCGRKHHFARMCRDGKKDATEDKKGNEKKGKDKKVHHTENEQVDSDDSGSSEQVDSEDSCSSDLFHARKNSRIGAVSDSQKNKFMVDMYFSTDYPRVKKVQLDTGATCSAMSVSDLHEILQDATAKLEPAQGNIKLYDGTIVQPLGTYTLKVSVAGGNPCTIKFDIVPKAPWPIIDGNTCVKNQWITMEIHSITGTKTNTPLTRENVIKEYNDVFKGLGCLPGDYHIELDPSVKPVQHAPRRIPVPLKAMLKNKISELEKMGVIEKVDGPSDWISSLVAVKKGDKLRICIDPRDLNKAIKRPKFQMPTVDEVLPNLAQAKVFSVLDAKDGFFQIKLDKASSKLTTFWTPFGKYRYRRCPFGISSAPEEYQRRQKELLEGLAGVDVIADDIICYGCGETVEEAEADHDRNFIAILERARKVNLKLNSKKMMFKLDCVPYMGHLLTKNGVKADPR